MFGMGTIINTLAILLGGVLGALFGKFLNENAQETLTKVCGVSTLFIALSGAMEGMLSMENGSIVSSGSMLIVICLALGAVVGEAMNIEDGFERFGEWLKVKSGNARDPRFVNAFVTASLTVCIGAMAIVGSIQDGMTGDYSVLATKAVLDLIIIMVMSCSLGHGAVFSANDGFCTVQSVSGGKCADILRGHQSAVGQENQSGKSAACHRICRDCGISAVLKGGEFSPPFFVAKNLLPW